MLGMAILCPLVIALIFGLLPELSAMKNPPIRGEITFRTERPGLTKQDSPVSEITGNVSRWSMDWLEERYENLMSWDKNPWKIPRSGFGDHYFKLLDSKDPLDIARTKELRRLADALHQRMLVRYPELAVASKNVPPERNGFLKWLEFSERFTSKPQSKGIKFPEEVSKHINGEAPWNAEATKAWLAREKPLMDEIRAIGLMPEQSIADIDVHRWAFFSARLAKNCAEALQMEARLAAGEGNAAAALESIQAANGIAAHLANVETPTLLAVTVQVLIQLQTQKYAFSEIMPALPAGQLDPAAWEKALNPNVSPPGEFARIMKGEWNVTAREYLLPMLVDTEDPKYPPDPEALLDHYAGFFLNVVQDHEGRPLEELPDIPVVDFPDGDHLSRQSRQVTIDLGLGSRAWRKGWERAQSVSAMNQAAFAILKGQPVPNDPIYGQPYVWDPANRKLSPPHGEAFKDMEIKPITMPKTSNTNG